MARCKSESDPTVLAVAQAMRAEMGRIDRDPARPWHMAEPRNQKVWLTLARVALETAKTVEAA